MHARRYRTRGYCEGGCCCVSGSSPAFSSQRGWGRWDLVEETLVISASRDYTLRIWAVPSLDSEEYIGSEADGDKLWSLRLLYGVDERGRVIDR
jgi:WD40 repeat protein